METLVTGAVEVTVLIDSDVVDVAPSVVDWTAIGRIQNWKMKIISASHAIKNECISNGIAYYNHVRCLSVYDLIQFKQYFVHK